MAKLIRLLRSGGGSGTSGGGSGTQRGAIGYVLLWMLGVPIPLLIVFALLRGCT